MSNWSKKEKFERAVLSEFGINTTINQNKKNNNHYINRIEYNGKSIEIEEKMVHGLTKYVNLYVNESVISYKNYKEAEVAGFAYLKG